MESRGRAGSYGKERASVSERGVKVEGAVPGADEAACPSETVESGGRAGRMGGRGLRVRGVTLGRALRRQHAQRSQRDRLTGTKKCLRWRLCAVSSEGCGHAVDNTEATIGE